ncbi:kelch repeat-containing protein, partial [Vibrio sp. 10N.222.46.A1]
MPLLAASVCLSTASFAKDQWPDLPVGMKSGISAQVGSKLYVGLGSTGQDFYMLDLEYVKKGWQKKADFSGPARSGATASVVGENIYVFGGSGKNNSSDAAPVLFDTVYRYDAGDNTWARVNTQTPVGLLGAASYSPDNKQVLFFGGYNKGYFDKYLADINTTSRKD